MKNRLVVLWTLLALVTFLVFPETSEAQFIEDALRLAVPGLGVGARSLGMGGAYTGLADDYSATFWNPAGLALVKRMEFMGGLSNLSYGNSSTFFGNPSSNSNSSTSLNNVGFVFPYPTLRGSLSFAFGYNRVNDFTTGLSFDGFNSYSSIIPTIYNKQYDEDVAFNLKLNDSTGYTPITNNVNQRGTVLEGGGLNNWSFAGALDIAKELSLGLTLNISTGGYTYDRRFIEEDTKNIYSTFPWDFSKLTLHNTIDGDISGFGAKLGLLYRYEDIARFGITIRTPSKFTVKENYSTDGNSLFDNGDSFYYRLGGSDQYDVVTPWVFGGGASVSFYGFTVSGDADYTDYTQLQFENATADVMAYNTDIKSYLRPVTGLRIGGEYTIPNINVRLRGGYGYRPSPYEQDKDISDRQQKYWSVGVGFLVSETLMVDGAFVRGKFSTDRINYDSTSRTDENVTTDNFLFTLSYRF
jgi:long-subunit fatty acid transport protein